MKKVKLIKPKSWEELEAEADKAGGEWIAVDGKDLPPLKVVYPKKEIKV